MRSKYEIINQQSQNLKSAIVRLLQEYNNVNNGIQLVSLNDLPSGMYLMLLSFDGIQVETHKLVVSK